MVQDHSGLHSSHTQFQLFWLHQHYSKVYAIFLDKGFKLELPTFLFKFLRDSIRETRTGSSSKKGNFISNRRLISDILVENALVENLTISGLTVDLVKNAGKVFWVKNLKSMCLISKVSKPYYLPTKEDICGTRIPVDNFSILTKIDPQDVLAYYLDSCVKEGIDPLVDPFDLPDTFPDAYGKRKKDA